MNVGLVAAIVGLVSLIGSDLFGTWNRKKYRSDQKEGKANSAAFQQHIRRKAQFDRFTFCILVIAAGLSVYSAFADKRGADTEVSGIKSRLSSAESQFQATKNQFQVSEGRAHQIQIQQQKTTDRLNEMAQQIVAAGSRLRSLEDGSRSLRSRVFTLERQTRSRASNRGAGNDARAREQ